MAKKIKAAPTPDFRQRLTPALLGAAIHARRTQSKLRLIDAAALCGVSKQTLMNIEKGQESTHLNILLKVCSGLGINLYIQPWTESQEADDEWQ